MSQKLRVCYLGAFGRMELGDPMPRCSGELVRCHLIPRSVLRRHNVDELAHGSWVWGCGGPTGLGGHHGMFDVGRTLRLPREALPAATEELAMRIGLRWYLDRHYGLPGG
jgi:hypothetical protein